MNWMSATEIRGEHVSVELKAGCPQQASILGLLHFVAERTGLISFQSKAAELLVESSTGTVTICVIREVQNKGYSKVFDFSSSIVYLGITSKSSEYSRMATKGIWLRP